MYVYIQLYAFSIQNTHTHARPPVSCHAPSRLVPTFPLSISLSLSVGSFCLALLLDALYIYILYTVCVHTRAHMLLYIIFITEAEGRTRCDAINVFVVEFILYKISAFI